MRNLFGDKPEALSIEILRHYEPDEGYFGAFSGGKDSIVLKAVAEEAGVTVDWHYSVTTIDPPEVLRFMKEHHPDVQWDRPKRSFYQFIRDNKGLPFRNARWCCEELKERGGEGRVTLTGVRAAESKKRASYGVVQPCLRGKGKTLVHPLLPWRDEDIWAYIRAKDLPYCSLYDEGFKRIGCVFCPFETQSERALARWPRMFATLLRAMRVAYPTQKSWQKFGSAEAVLDWWLDRRRSYRDVDSEDQEVFAFDQFDEEK